MSKFATFRDLSGDARLAAFEAAALLLLARLLVAFIPLRHWRNQFGHVGKSEHVATLDAEDLQAARLVRQAIGRAMRNAPIDFICLPQALAARWMLNRRGIENQLTIGAQRGVTGAPELHAWLKSGDYWVTGDCEVSGYRVLASEAPQQAP